MEWEAWKDVLGSLAVPTVFVLVFTAVLWSDHARARKMARKWGIPEPTNGQVDEVLDYRRLRLACYPILFVVIGACNVLFVPLQQGQDGNRSDEGVPLIAMFLVGAVVAELLALPRTRRLPPVRLRFVDVGSRWGAGVLGVVVLMTFVQGLVDLQAEPYITPNVLGLAEQNKSHVGAPISVPFAGTAVVLLLVGFVVWSAQTRSFSADAELDRALRTRSARVVLGLGIAMQLSFLALSTWRMEFLGSYATGADLVGADPAETALQDWARGMDDFVELPTFLIAIFALISWIYVANPGRSGKVPQRRT